MLELDEIQSLEGPSGSEELLIRSRTCNFSSITEQTHDQGMIEAVWWTNVVCLPVIALIGLACNVLNIAILTSNRAARRIPSWQLLLALAICDCLFLIFATLEVTPSSIPQLAFSPTFNYLYSHCALYIRTLASTFYKSSVLIVVAFNVERYLCVVHPLRSHRLCTGSTSRAAIIASVFISLCFSLQWPLCYRIRLCFEGTSGQQYFVILLAESYTLQLYYRILDYLSLFAFNVLPIIALLAMNLRIILTLGKVADEDSKRRNGVGSDASSPMSDGSLVPARENEENGRMNANAMLFAVVLLLLLCVGPQAPARLLFELYGQYNSTAILYTCITQQLVFLNAALNFCLYCVVSRRYRTLMQSTVKRLLERVQRTPVTMGLKQSKTSSAHATSLDEPSARGCQPLVDRKPNSALLKPSSAHHRSSLADPTSLHPSLTVGKLALAKHRASLDEPSRRPLIHIRP